MQNQVPSSVQRNGNNQDRHATVADINRLDPSQASTESRSETFQVSRSASMPAKYVNVPSMKRELPESSQEKKCKAEMADAKSPLNVVKREDSSDEDIVIVLHLDKKACNHLRKDASSKDVLLKQIWMKRGTFEGPGVEGNKTFQVQLS